MTTITSQLQRKQTRSAMLSMYLQYFSYALEHGSPSKKQAVGVLELQNLLPSYPQSQSLSLGTLGQPQRNSKNGDQLIKSCGY